MMRASWVSLLVALRLHDANIRIDANDANKFELLVENLQIRTYS